MTYHDNLSQNNTLHIAVTVVTRISNPRKNYGKLQVHQSSVYYCITGTADDSMLPTYKSVDGFQYTNDGGYFVVKGTDNLPDDLDEPGRVTDLQVTAVDYNQKLVNIKFTAPGDDQDVGRGMIQVFR